MTQLCTASCPPTSNPCSHQRHCCWLGAIYRAAAAQLAQRGGCSTCPTGWLPPVNHTPRTLGRPPTLDVAVSSAPHVWPPAPSLLHCSLLLSIGSRSLAIQPWSTSCPPVNLKPPSSARSWYQTGDICRGVGGGAAQLLAGCSLVCARVLVNCVHAHMHACVPAMYEWDDSHG